MNNERRQLEEQQLLESKRFDRKIREQEDGLQKYKRDFENVRERFFEFSKHHEIIDSGNVSMAFNRESAGFDDNVRQAKKDIEATISDKQHLARQQSVDLADLDKKHQN